MRIALAGVLLLAAAAWAQAPAPAPEPRKEEPPRRLNLSIDGLDTGPRGHIRFGPSEKEPATSGGLPSLGAEAREMPKTPSTARTSPYPPDTNPGR